MSAVVVSVVAEAMEVVVTVLVAVEVTLGSVVVTAGCG